MFSMELTTRICSVTARKECSSTRFMQLQRMPRPTRPDGWRIWYNITDPIPGSVGPRYCPNFSLSSGKPDHCNTLPSCTMRTHKGVRCHESPRSLRSQVLLPSAGTHYVLYLSGLSMIVLNTYPIKPSDFLSSPSIFPLVFSTRGSLPPLSSAKDYKGRLSRSDIVPPLPS